MADAEKNTEFVVTQTREIAGQWREEGARVKMSNRAAKYYLPPYGSGLARPKAKRSNAPIVAATDDEDVETDV